MNSIHFTKRKIGFLEGTGHAKEKKNEEAAKNQIKQYAQNMNFSDLIKWHFQCQHI